MKHKFPFLATLIPAVMMMFTACVKKADTFTDFASVQDLVIIPGSGLANFGAASVVFTPATGDTIRYDVYVNLASINKSGKDVTVTVGVDDAKRTTYNTENSTEYLPFTSEMYSFPTTSLTIKAGERVAKVPLEIYAGTYDVTKSYMLPISITDASGKKLSSNLNTTYYHLIGNVLAGNYLWDYTRWNTSDYSGAVNGSSFTGETAIFLPVSSTALSIQSGYGETVGVNCHYILSFTDSSGVPINFKVTIDPAESGGLTANSIQLVDGPHLLLADPVNKHFKFSFSVVNSTPAPRSFIDEFY